MVILFFSNKFTVNFTFLCIKATERERAREKELPGDPCDIRDSHTSTITDTHTKKKTICENNGGNKKTDQEDQGGSYLLKEENIRFEFTVMNSLS